MKRLLLVSTFEGFGNKIDQACPDLSQLNVVCIPTAAFAYDSYD